MKLLSSGLASACLACAVAGPARGQTVTFADLEGAVIIATMEFEESGLANGRMYSGIYRVEKQLIIGPGDTLQDTATRTSEGPRGTRVQHDSGSFTLGKPKQMSNFGGGHALYLFSNGTLVLLRTYNCRIRAPYAREKGGDVEMTGAFGGHLEHWTQKLISSSCHVSKR
jgi:hypothetical protein